MSQFSRGADLKYVSIFFQKRCHAESWPGLRPQPNGSSHEDKVAEFAKIQPAHRRRRLNFRKFSYAGPFSLPSHKKPCQENQTLRICSAELAAEEPQRSDVWGFFVILNRWSEADDYRPVPTTPEWMAARRSPPHAVRSSPSVSQGLALVLVFSANSALQTRRVLLFWRSFSLRRWSIGVVREF